MGLYIEPGTGKSDWCGKNGTKLAEGTEAPSILFSDVNENEFIVCVVDNVMFEAGAVAFSESEFECFKRPDGRYKRWYSVRKELLEPICPAWNDYIRS